MDITWEEERVSPKEHTAWKLTIVVSQKMLEYIAPPKVAQRRRKEHIHQNLVEQNSRTI